MSNGFGMGCIYAKEQCEFTAAFRFDLRAIDNAFHCGETQSQSPRGKPIIADLPQSHKTLKWHQMANQSNHVHHHLYYMLLN